MKIMTRSQKSLIIALKQHSRTLAMDAFLSTTQSDSAILYDASDLLDQCIRKLEELS